MKAPQTRRKAARDAERALLAIGYRWIRDDEDSSAADDEDGTPAVLVPPPMGVPSTTTDEDREAA